MQRLAVIGLGALIGLVGLVLRENLAGGGVAVHHADGALEGDAVLLVKDLCRQGASRQHAGRDPSLDPPRSHAHHFVCAPRLSQTGKKTLSRLWSA